MPSLDTARRISSMKYNGAKTVGQILKEESDFIMEDTWDNDCLSKICYIYDYAHDDQPHINVGMTYENTTKTKIDAKIFISKYGSINKDKPELQCMFKPSQKVIFDENDELYYMEDYKSKYGVYDIFVGMYLDYPDKDGIYHKHLICSKDVEQNFQKYFILPCDHKLQFIRTDGLDRIKQEIWCVLRSQSSYNSGLWTDYTFTSVENQEILFLPTNPISDNIGYISENNHSNQRIIIDIPNYKINWSPNTWQVSKVEKVNTKGITKITLKQVTFDCHTDYIEKDYNGNITGMWADYYTSQIEPSDPEDHKPNPSTRCEIVSSTKSLKVGGSYKLLTAKIYDSENTEQVDAYETCNVDWKCYLDNQDYSGQVIWLPQKDLNKIKIKFPDERSCLGKILNIQCTFLMDESSLVATLPLELII